MEKSFDISDLVEEITKYKMCPICNGSENKTFTSGNVMTFTYFCGTKMEINSDKSMSIIEKCTVGKREDTINELLLEMDKKTTLILEESR